MKNIFCLFIVLCITTSVYSKDNNELKLLKSPEKLSDIGSLSDIGCDLCGCYMGIDPNYHMNLVGFRFHTFKFVTETHLTESLIQNDHPDHEGTQSTEYYNDLELFGRYYFTPKIRVLFSIPFSRNNIDGKILNGFGDAKLLAQFQIYNTDINGKTKYWQRIFLGGGIKLPTGVYNKTLTYGVVEPHFQPGTGAFDFIFTGTYISKLLEYDLGWSTDVVYTFNTVNSNDYRFANRFNLTSSVFYEADAGNFAFLPHAGVYFETAKEDKYKGETAEGSGGSVLFATGGLDIYYKKFSLDMTLQLPVNENLIGEQPENRFRIYTGFGYSF